MPAWPETAAAAAVGAALGSFAVTAGVRMARGEGWVTGRSHCDHCGCRLGFWQTAPVVSYVGLRGACAQCGGRIDPAHLAGEVSGAIVGATALSAASPLPIGLAIVLGLTLITASAVDAKTERLPNVLTGLVALAAAGLTFIRAGAPGLLTGAVAAALAAAVLLALRALSRGRDGELGLGLGDVKLVAALALWLGAATPLMVSLAALLGLTAVLVLRLPRRIPFGPYIAAAGWLVGCAGQAGWLAWAL